MGPEASASYFMGIRTPLPLASLIVEPSDLWDEETGLHVNPKKRGMDWERPVNVTYVDRDRSAGFQIAAGLRIHGQFSRAYAKKSFRLYFREEYGAARLDYPIFPNNALRSFKRLFYMPAARMPPKSQPIGRFCAIN